MIDHPKVFISYSWDNEPHKKWVLDLANKLRSNGVDVLLDRYYLHAGKNLHSFVENALKTSHKILVVLTPNYKLKAEDRAGGVGHEYSLINNELVRNITKNERIIPLLRQGSTDESIPAFLQPYIYIELKNDKNFSNQYEQLIREIYSEPKIRMPELGTKPNFENFDKKEPNEGTNKTHQLTIRDHEAAPANNKADHTAIKIKIRKLVSDGKVEKALSNLEAHMQASDHDDSNDLIMLKSRFNRLKKGELTGVLSSEHVRTESNQIVFAILNIVGKL